MAVGAKSKNAKVGGATTNILKSLTGGKILSLTDIHGNGLKIESYLNHFKDSLLSK